ncbi:MAG: glycerophosphodiester phosphodiesterase [Myxococcota bacterium]|nr:glycerophosphodiester phosphodiesterase [Myxococcota bacterium]
MTHPYLDLPLPLVIGHRGCAGEVPENTLLAFARGISQGAHILESDVHLTRDGVPVLIHDPQVDRITDASGAVADYDLESLQQLDAGYRFARGDQFPFRDQGLAIPTLAEALARFPTARFNLEFKADSPEMVKHGIDSIEAAGAAERVLLAAESGTLMQEIYRELAGRGLAPAIGASGPDVLAFLRAALDGTPPPAGPMALQVPAAFRGRPLVTPDFVAHAHRHGLQVHVWTIDEPDEMDRLLDLGVDGIITDYPALLVERIAARA